MDKRLNRLLQEYYRAPVPEKKQAFLRRYSPRRILPGHMLLTQLKYISPLTWLLSVLLFSAAFLVTLTEPTSLEFGWLYGMTPFLVTITVTECLKSCRHGMQELETSALFSLHSILLMRMLILGTANFAALAVLSLAVGTNPLAQLMYLLVPYLLTAALCLALVKRYRGTESTGLCSCAATALAAVQILIRSQCAFLYAAGYVPLWFLAAVAAALFAAWESARTLRALKTS